MFKVVEKFVSINGEARKQGELAVFVRFAGCNLNCVYCDTKWANERDVKYSEESAEEIVLFVKEKGVSNVTLTGGEPLLAEGLERLLHMLTEEGISVEIETNGSRDISQFFGISERISFTVDYKTAGSRMEEMMFMDNFRNIRENDTVKFVVSDRVDLDRMVNIVSEYDLINKSAVYVSAVFGKITPAEIVDYMIEKNLNGIKLQLQMHKYIWDPNLRGV